MSDKIRKLILDEAKKIEATGTEEPEVEVVKTFNALAGSNLLVGTRFASFTGRSIRQIMKLEQKVAQPTNAELQEQINLLTKLLLDGGEK